MDGILCLAVGVRDSHGGHLIPDTDNLVVTGESPCRVDTNMSRKSRTMLVSITQRILEPVKAENIANTRLYEEWRAQRLCSSCRKELTSVWSERLLGNCGVEGQTKEEWCPWWDPVRKEDANHLQVPPMVSKRCHPQMNSVV